MIRVAVLDDHPAVLAGLEYAGPGLAVGARVAGADALVSKTEPVAALLSAIRRVAGGERVLPAIPLDLRHAAMARLDDDDAHVAIAAMLLAGTSHQDIAEALGIERRDVARRVRRIVARILRDARHDATADRRVPQRVA